MLGYTQVTSRPDISMTTYQCASFNANPKLCHERAVLMICKHLLDIKDKGIMFIPDKTKGLYCHVDADFSGGWTNIENPNQEAVPSHTGFVISYAGCSIYWHRKLKT